jgi:electron transfer flavoprotein alpha subunit
MKALLVFDRFNSFYRNVEDLNFEKYFASFDPASRYANFVPNIKIVEPLTGADFIAKITKNNAFDIIIFSNELVVRETASYFAGRFNLGLIAHSEEILLKDDNIIGLVPGWENINALVVSYSIPKLIILKSNELIKFSFNDPQVIPVTETNKISLINTEKVIENPLKSAQRIVGIGRGVKKDIYAKVFEFARLINAEIACTRPVADEGLLSPDKVVGDSGVAVSPNVYIALGVSGAIQHMDSINAKYIIAVNIDMHAPIFGRSDISINQKVEEVIDGLIILISSHNFV